jgi:HEAT repeat protein
VALVVSWRAAGSEPRPTEPAAAAASPAAGAAPAASPAGAPGRSSAAFVTELQTMADVHRLREQCAAATAAAIPDLRDLALSAADPIVVGYALTALARLGALAGDDAFIVLLHDARPRVRQQFALALGDSGTAAVPWLRELTHDGDLATRSLALASLGRVGGAEALAVLEAIAGQRDLDAATRLQLNEALRRARDPGHGRRPPR